MGSGSPNRLLQAGSSTVVAPVEPPVDTAPPVDTPSEGSIIDSPGGGTVTVPAPPSAGAAVDVPLSIWGGGGLLRFEGLSGTGQLTVIERAGRPAGGRGLDLPSGYVDMDYAGSSFRAVEVCLPGTRGSRLFHFPDSGSRRDVTTRFDANSGLVCGTTTEFSAFATGTLATVRLAGADRYARAVAVSTFRRSAIAGTDSSTVYLATGESEADALAAGAAAAAADAVVLLTRGGSLPASTRAELSRRRPTEVVVVGGTMAIADTVVDAVREAAPAANVRRVFGVTRYSTAVELSRLAFPSGANVVYLATGVGYADTLATAAVAGAGGCPLLITRPDSVPLPVRRALQRLAPARIVVLGGPAAITARAELELAAYLPG